MKEVKLADTDYLYLTGRVRSLERSLLSKVRREQMLDARTDEDAAKVLLECGYGEISISTPHELEQALQEDYRKMLESFEAVCPDQTLIDIFRIKYDYHNVKAIIKADARGAPVEPILIDCGCVPVKMLLDLLRQEEIKGLPPKMCAAATEARDLLARTSDPQQSDMILDRACFVDMSGLAAKSKSLFLQGYVRLYIDSSNLSTLVRALRTGRGFDFLRLAMVQGGNVDTGRLIATAVSEAPLSECFAGSLLETAAIAGPPAIRRETTLTNFEKLCNEAMTKYVKTSKLVAFGEQPLLGYIAAREDDIVTIRTIMSSRKARVPSEVIRERLREAYV